MALPDPVIHLYWAHALARAKEDVQGHVLPHGRLWGASRTRVRQPGPEENHLPVLQGTSESKGRQRKGEMIRPQRASASVPLLSWA